MSMTIHVDIVSAEAEIYSGLAEMVYAPGELGELGIAPRHAPLVTRLRPGEIHGQRRVRFLYIGRYSRSSAPCRDGVSRYCHTCKGFRRSEST